MSASFPRSWEPYGSSQQQPLAWRRAATRPSQSFNSRPANLPSAPAWSQPQPSQPPNSLLHHSNSLTPPQQSNPQSLAASLKRHENEAHVLARYESVRSDVRAVGSRVSKIQKSLEEVEQKAEKRHNGVTADIANLHGVCERFRDEFRQREGGRVKDQDQQGMERVVKRVVRAELDTAEKRSKTLEGELKTVGRGLEKVIRKLEKMDGEAPHHFDHVEDVIKNAMGDVNNIVERVVENKVENIVKRVLRKEIQDYMQTTENAWKREWKVLQEKERILNEKERALKDEEVVPKTEDRVCKEEDNVGIDEPRQRGLISSDPTTVDSEHPIAAEEVKRNMYFCETTISTGTRDMFMSKTQECTVDGNEGVERSTQRNCIPKTTLEPAVDSNTRRPECYELISQSKTCSTKSKTDSESSFRVSQSSESDSSVVFVCDLRTRWRRGRGRGRARGRGRGQRRNSVLRSGVRKNTSGRARREVHQFVQVETQLSEGPVTRSRTLKDVQNDTG